MQVGDIIGASRVETGIEMRQVLSISPTGVVLDILRVKEGDPQWLTALSMLPEDGGAVIGAQAAPTLLEIKSQAVAGVLRVTGEVREFFVSNIPGQDMVYLRKEEEARIWLTDPTPNITNYPFLQAEVGITAETPYQLAQVWLYMAAQWIVIAALIEHYRFTATSQIALATTADEVARVVSSFNTHMGTLL